MSEQFGVSLIFYDCRLPVSTRLQERETQLSTIHTAIRIQPEDD